jgi:hypothetical protein
LFHPDLQKSLQKRDMAHAAYCIGPQNSPSAQRGLSARVTGFTCYIYLSSSLRFFQDLRGRRSHLLSAHLSIHSSTISKSRTPVLAFPTQPQPCCPRHCPNTIIEPEWRWYGTQYAGAPPLIHENRGFGCSVCRADSCHAPTEASHGASAANRLHTPVLFLINRDLPTYTARTGNILLHHWFS